MPDTLANQEAYPHPASQKPGPGFPLCRLVGIICLSSGGLLDAATAAHKGKGGDEQALLRSMLGTLQANDILLGDAYYATYFLFCSLLENGIDAVFVQQGARRRSTDFRRGQRLGQRDHLIRLQKPKKKPEWMAQTDYDQSPDSITIRELASGGKVLVTTLFCAKKTTKADLKAVKYECTCNYWRNTRNFIRTRRIRGSTVCYCKSSSTLLGNVIYLMTTCCISQHRSGPPCHPVFFL